MGRANRRSGSRRTLLLNAHCRVAFGNSPEIWLLDLSTSGCQLFGRIGLVRQGEEVVIRPAGLEPQRGTVVWVSGQKAGVQFDQPLHPSVVEHLAAAKPTAQPTAQQKEPVADKFGRPLPRQSLRAL